MSSPDLLSICAAAFVGVFLLLCILAALMRLILYIFPQKTDTIDAMVMASVATSVIQRMYPGARVTRIEEIK
jgi:hypothetical protein